MTGLHSTSQFDQYAGAYDEALSKGLAVSGENRDYFGEGRISFLRDRLLSIRSAPRRVMDFGCGDGASMPFLLSKLSPEAVHGVDLSADSILAARAAYRDPRFTFEVLGAEPPGDEMDLVYTNGVFHHIPPGERLAAVNFIWKSLRRGGIFALWENNPWNPGTRYVMSRIPFDRDANPLSFREAQRLVRSGGFRLLQTDFLFIFPRALRLLRPLERRLSRLPLGAQYQVLCQKP